ncbi:hypothetical protein STCU_07222 [Strigomonas culicis]|uniref:Regulator of chromosome condensation n=2 Tax=Strigomonas culicis TaxID=28005 RepID=S9VMB6_9TRYP|nr:hypothetical protein STCU_07222 [Strigomonas culicis]|eukprot:EPY24355.1 hypothetical protein STCU_07222 [Strigomonas culicis]
MFRRLHTRIIGQGALCGLPASPPAEVFLKTLPPPNEVDAAKYARFKREEEAWQRQPPPAGPTPGEPFFDFVAGAAGHKHFVLLTGEGNAVTVGDNRFGQTAAPNEGGAGGGASPPPASVQGGKGEQRASTDWAPLFIDLAGMFTRDAPASAKRVACGSNFSLIYQKGSRRVIGFGNNHVGQLGAGGKQPVSAAAGFVQWDPQAAWWPSRDARCVVDEIVCGYNHAVARLTDGSLYAFGSNTWGELAIGHTTSPMDPTRIAYFDAKPHMRVRKVAAGNSFTLFLTQDGRVYGCGATNEGQLPPNAFEPVPIPLTRSFQAGGAGEGGSNKLIRIKDVACVGGMAVYVSSHNELLVQGALSQFGVLVPSPRFAAVDQSTVREQFSQLAGRALPADGFAVAQLHPGPSTLLVQYRNGCVAGLGANAEGQLYSRMKTVNGRSINLAPTFAVSELFPVFVPSPAAEVTGRPPWFASGKGFTLLFDNNEVYRVNETTRPIELPPGRRDLLRRSLRHELGRAPK